MKCKLATARTYSPGRAAARLELVLAEAFGGSRLAHELAGKPPAVIATARVTVPVKERRALSLRAAPLGARLLRFLGVKGLSRPDTGVRLRITSTRGATKHTVTKLLKFR